MKHRIAATDTSVMPCTGTMCYSAYTSTSGHVTASPYPGISSISGVFPLIILGLIVLVVVRALPHIKNVDDAVKMLRVLVPWYRRKR